MATHKIELTQDDIVEAITLTTAFSVPATNAILKKLDTLIPGWRQ
jgi:hypothetical protein